MEPRWSMMPRSIRRMKKVTHQVSLLFTCCISTHDLTISPGLLTGQSGELLLIVVELVDHIYHARSNTPSGYRVTSTTRYRQSYKTSVSILPITVSERECVQLQDLGGPRLVRIDAELYTVQRAIQKTLGYLILRRTLASCHACED